MEWVGLISLAIILMYSSYPAKVKKLERKVKNLESKQRGDISMSKIIEDLVGKRCKIKTEEEPMGILCTVLEVDDEWLKITYSDKKNIEKTKIIRIESVNDVELSD